MNAVPTVTAAPILASDRGNDKRVACGEVPPLLRGPEPPESRKVLGAGRPV